MARQKKLKNHRVTLIINPILMNRLKFIYKHHGGRQEWDGGNRSSMGTQWVMRSEFNDWLVHLIENNDILYREECAIATREFYNDRSSECIKPQPLSVVPPIPLMNYGMNMPANLIDIKMPPTPEQEDAKKQDETNKPALESWNI
jgi:hypothetical protein